MSHFPGKPGTHKGGSSIRRLRVFGSTPVTKPARIRVSGSCRFGTCILPTGHKGKHSLLGKR